MTGICVLSVYTNIYVHIYYSTDKTTLRPDMLYAITHNTSGNINTTNMSGNEWNTITPQLDDYIILCS